jgi:two-component system CheB/CheR fusion protein
MSRERRFSSFPGSGYVLAVFATAAAFGLRYALWPLLGLKAPFLFFVLAVAVVARIAGLWPGLLATLLGGVLAVLYFIPPQHTFRITNSGDLLNIVFYAVLGITFSVLCESLHVTRRRLESQRELLEESDQFHAAIADLTSDFAFKGRIEPDQRIVIESVTKGFGRLFGYAAEELRERGWESLIHPQDMERTRRELLPLFAGEIVESHARCLTRDGRLIWMQYRVRPERDTQGRVVSLHGAARDFTRQKATDEAVREREDRLKALAEAAPSIIWTASPDGALTYANPQWIKYTGLTPEQSARDWPRLVLHPDDYERCMKAWTLALETGAEFLIEARNRRRDGVYRWFVMRAVPFKDESGRVIAWYGATTDIQDQKELEERLRHADERKNEFLATLAHELRNPLAPLRNALHIMRVSADDPAAVENARAIMGRQVDQMVRLVDDLLDVSRITHGSLELRRERVDLDRVLRAALETSGPVLSAAGHGFEVRLPTHPVFLDGDPTRLAQVFSNLLNNAAKYTPRGGRVTLEAEVEGDQAVIGVRDDGEGIPLSLLSYIFEMFAQADRTIERSHGGLGVGLTLVKKLVELHGGSVEARSEGPGRGSEFVVRLPLSTSLDGTSAPIEEVASTPAMNGGRRIMIVDDNADAAESLSLLLEHMGHRVRVAYDGEQALVQAAADPPEIVLLDIGLPGLNGYEVARRMRQQEWGRPLTLIALTGWGQEEDRRRSQEAGFNAHIVKPVEPARLGKVLAEAEAAPVEG